MNSFLQDLRYGLRMLGKAPAFTAIAIMTLALGIGANTAIFSAVNGIILKPLPYAHSSQLIRVVSSKTNGDLMLQSGVSIPDALDIKTQCAAIADTATYERSEAVLTGIGAPDKVSSASVAGNFFNLLGVRPMLGRAIEPPDTTPGQANVVVLSYAVWRGLLSGDPGWVGRQITLNSKPYKVIGVMPRSFDFGSSDFGDGGSSGMVWLAHETAPGDNTNRDSRNYGLVARLKTGATTKEVAAQLKTLGARLGAAYPKEDGGWEMTSASLKDFKVGYLSQPLFLLLGAVGFVLLIACVNISGLLLARGWGRHKEVAIREALGATRFRIVRQFLCESMLLSIAGGALGLLLSLWGIAALRALAPANTPRLDEVQLSATVLWFALGVSLAAGILFGLAPALQVSGRRIETTLRESFGGGTGAVSSRHPRKLRGALLIFELALAVILVAGAALVARSFAKLNSIDLGFHSDHLLTMSVNFSKATCDAQAKDNSAQCLLAQKNVLARIQSLPGVKNAAEVSGVPLESSGIALTLSVGGQPKQFGFSAGSPIWYRYVTPDYFSLMGVHLIEGRAFSNADVTGGERVAIVNQTFAKKYLSAQPLGKRISYHKDHKGQPEWLDIIGEVSDVRDFALESDTEPEFYSPLDQASTSFQPNLMLRTASDPLALVPAVKEAVAAVEQNAPVTNVKTMEQILSASAAQPRFQTVLLGLFGALGLILAMVGIYGVISYSVTQRTREIGVRMALGAQPKNVLRMVLREGMFLAGAGIIVGIGGALALGRVLSSLLFGIKPTDPATFIGVSIALALVALAACYIPARRAMRVDPMVALRYE